MELGAAQQLSEGRRCGCRAVPPLSLSTDGVLARRRRALLLRPHLKRLVRHGHHLSKGSGADPDSFFDDFEVYRSRIKGAKFFDRKQIRGREASGSSQIFPEPSQSGGVRVWGMRVAAMGRGNGSKLSKKPSYSFVRFIQGGRRFSKGVLILSHLIGGRDVAAVPPSAGRPPVGPTFTVGEITLTAAGGGLTGDE